MNKDQRFWDKLAERYSRQPIANEAAYQTKLEKTREHFSPESRVLEFGCGTGGTAISHAPLVDHILATDLSAEMLSIAQAKADAAEIDNVSFQKIGFDDLQAEAASFDVVLGLSILHLLRDRDAAIAKVHNLLKPGGVFVSSTVCMGEKLWIFKLVAPVGRFLGFLPILKVFTGKQLRHSMLEAGFKIEHEWRPEKSQTSFIIARKPAAQ
jgi:ubiquinone/menaquinone biosynthesis C-methylase UbiE